MAKVLKIGLLVAAIAVNVIPGAGQAISVAILSATGIGLSAAAAVALTATTLALSASAIKVGAKSALGAGGTGLTSRVSVDPSIKQWIVIGETAMPTQLIYFGTSGANNENLSMVFVHACHPIAGFTGLNLNNVATAFPTPSGPYAGILSIETADGTQTANPFTSVNGGEWGAAQIGQGLTLSHFRWTYDQAKLASGLPQNVQFIGKGIRVYDPRRDSTRGGSGSHRADNEATWQYEVSGVAIGRNPALVELSYRLGWRKAGRLWAGMGEDPANIDYASYIASANICDEIVNGKPRYRIDGLLSLGDIHNVNIGKILATCAGKPLDSGGLIGIWVGHDDTAAAAMTIGQGDWVGDIGWQPLPEGEVRNTARGEFIDPTSFFQSQPYIQVQPADLVALDNGEELVDTLDFAMVQDADQARRLASIRLRESRQGKLSGPTALKSLGLRPSNVVAVNHPRAGWTARRFRVETMALAIDKVQLSMRAVQSSDYADVANVAMFVPGSLPTIGYIPVLGVLAYRDFVDFSTEVVGAEKPQDNATRNDDGGNMIRSPGELDFFFGNSGVAVVERFTTGTVTNGIVDRVRMRFNFAGFAAWSQPNAEGIAPYRASEGERLFYYAKVLREAGAAGALRLKINYYDAALSNFFSVPVATFSGPNGVFTVIGDSFVCPAGTAYAFPIVETDSDKYLCGDGFLGRSQPGADVTALAVPALTVPPSTIINFDYTGTVVLGDLPRTLRAVRTRGGVDVSSSTTWSLVDPGFGASIDSAGGVTITACPGTGNLGVVSNRDGVELTQTIAVIRDDGPPPSGGSGGGSSASDSTLDSVSSSSYGSPIAGPMTVTAGSAGRIDLYANLGLIVTTASPAGSFGAFLKWQWRIVGGSFADAGSEVSEVFACIVNNGGGGYYDREDGQVECNVAVTGLTPGTDYEVQLLGRTPSGTRTRSFYGTASAVGS